MAKTITIIGSGPIGLEAALAAKEQGYLIRIYESGEIADSVRQWGRIRMFSPFSMNASDAGLAVLRALGKPIPAPNALLTGAEYARDYLIPIGEHLGVQTQTAVKALVREGASKRDKIGAPDRAETPFRLLVCTGGSERNDTADIIFDCSGTFKTPNPLGDGGIPVPGETAAASAISYLGDLDDLGTFAGKRVLVVGGGHSGATGVCSLAALTANHPETQITWLVKRACDLPCQRVADDPLPERDRLCTEANALVSGGKITLRSGLTIHALSPTSNGVEVSLQNPAHTETLTVDRIVVTTGFRPDTHLARELHVQNCWATEGTYPLAASLLGETGGDCLAVASFGAETLTHPEPNYFTLGMKSYGRTPDFLIRTGRQQITDVLDWLKTSDRAQTTA
jgi:thioredoxin reductase